MSARAKKSRVERKSKPRASVASSNNGLSDAASSSSSPSPTPLPWLLVGPRALPTSLAFHSLSFLSLEDLSLLDHCSHATRGLFIDYLQQATALCMQSSVQFDHKRPLVLVRQHSRRLVRLALPNASPEARAMDEFLFLLMTIIENNNSTLKNVDLGGWLYDEQLLLAAVSSCLQVDQFLLPLVNYTMSEERVKKAEPPLRRILQECTQITCLDLEALASTQLGQRLCQTALELFAGDSMFCILVHQLTVCLFLLLAIQIDHSNCCTWQESTLPIPARCARTSILGSRNLGFGWTTVSNLPTTSPCWSICSMPLPTCPS